MLKILQITDMDHAKVTEGQLFEDWWLPWMWCYDSSSRAEYKRTPSPHISPPPALATVNNKWNDPIVMINDLEEVKIISTNRSQMRTKSANPPTPLRSWATLIQHEPDRDSWNIVTKNPFGLGRWGSNRILWFRNEAYSRHRCRMTGVFVCMVGTSKIMQLHFQQNEHYW